ncbi:MAG: ChrR family anti-sigma-E factor [Pseudohongiellaceae bacterium]
MVSFHPDSRFLTDFTTGSLPLSEALCVSAHLYYCGKCRARVQQLTDVGSHLFNQLAPETAESGDDFETLMQRIEQNDAGEPVSDDLATSSRVSVSDPLVGRMPSVLGKLFQQGLDSLQWVQLGRSLRIAPVDLGDERRETALYDIRAGGRMPEHEHRGEEITVLLKGSFSDRDGKYSRGDFVVRNAGEAHQPTATQDTDCVCLISLERPVKARALFYRLLEPLVQYRLSRFSN